VLQAAAAHQAQLHSDPDRLTGEDIANRMMMLHRIPERGAPAALLDGFTALGTLRK
jgi:hypothetical protein